MADRWWQDVQSDPVHEQAAEWLARLENPQVSLEETTEWQRWMQADTRHVQAFGRMEEVGKALSGMGRPDVDESPLAPRRKWVALAAWVAAAASGMFWYLDAPREVMRTAVGENRSLRLDDGSRVTLGGSTELHVAFDDKSRRVKLARGEAFFMVARETSRPFTVDAGNATVRVVGTEFNVRRGQDRVVIAVVAGRVIVEPAAPPRSDGAAQRNPVQLDAGQQTTVDGKSVRATTRLANPDTATAWRSGQLTFRGEPLRHVVEDVNRYAAKPVAIDEASMGDLRFTGTVLDDNVGGWIASLESVFGLEAVEENERIVLKRKTPSP